ncbi:hypothetical protein CFP56_039820 [Quercus suber]|uniref:Uncharacterized protein n=1 Tax=Quercus suber TaxID=58331 RepID=A0AAW0LL95_QUESU
MARLSLATRNRIKKRKLVLVVMFCWICCTLLVCFSIIMLYVEYHMESTTLNFQDPSKRKWTPVEDIKLVEALVEYRYEKEANLENKVITWQLLVETNHFRTMKTFALCMQKIILLLKMLKHFDDKLDDFHEDMDCTQILTPSCKGEEQNARKRKRRIQSGEDNMVEAMKEVTIILTSQLKDALDNRSKAVIGLHVQINEELLKILRLTTKEHHKTAKLITCQHELTDIFMSKLDAK